jgi:hypothetical protein
MNPVHANPTYLLKIKFNIILLTTSGVVLSGLPTKPYMHSSSPPYVLHALPASTLIFLSILITFGE